MFEPEHLYKLISTQPDPDKTNLRAAFHRRLKILIKVILLEFCREFYFVPSEKMVNILFKYLMKLCQWPFSHLVRGIIEWMSESKSRRPIISINKHPIVSNCTFKHLFQRSGDAMCVKDEGSITILIGRMTSCAGLALVLRSMLTENGTLTPISALWFSSKR